MNSLTKSRAGAHAAAVLLATLPLLVAGRASARTAPILAALGHDTEIGTGVRNHLGGQLELDAAARSAGADAGWWQHASAQLEAAEYQASRAEAGLQAPNRAQNLRTYFRNDGIEIVPRQANEATAPWHFAWRTAGWGRADRMQSLVPGATAPQANGTRVVYAHEGLDEWYENKSAGLEQGFTVHRRPAGAGPLQIEGRLSGELCAELAEDGAVALLDGQGACALRYAELRAWDADGAPLASRLVVDGESLAILVEDGGARYPLTIDPLMSSPAWTAESNQASAQFAFSAGAAGDVNGDGFSDVIVGAFAYDNGQVDEGRAFVYHGSATGLGLSPAWTAERNQADARFGYAVGTAGDVNGDGFSDVIIGAYTYDNGETDEGRAFVYHGSASGLATSAAWTADSDQVDALYGYTVGTAGDVNGDGYAEVIVGAPLFDNGQADEGRAFVYRGGASGLTTTPVWTAESNQAAAQFGTAVATAGDVNADGFADVIVGAMLHTNGQSNEGQARVYHGSASGLGTLDSWIGECNQADAYFGCAVGSAGDVDGDGYGDVIVGAYALDFGQTNEGGAFVYRGSSQGLATSAAWLAEGNQEGALFGYAVGTAGDVNGDGFADVIVSAIYFDNGQTDEGQASVYHGSAAGLSLTPAWTAEGDQASAYYGTCVATVGDVNGDGFSDVIVGAYLYDNGQADEGRAFVYHGAGDGLASAIAWIADGDQTNAQFGFSVGAAGDVNGDGYSDVIVGAPYYDNGQAAVGRALVYLGSATGPGQSAAWVAESDQDLAWFGFSVGTAGDVNGDGYSDVIVGAPYYDNEQVDEGRAFVYLGGAAGLSPSPTWTAESDQAGAAYGVSVGTAGDVNGDGFADIIVGAPSYDNGVPGGGRAYVYHGSAVGPRHFAAWSTGWGNAVTAFGYSVGTAGDVNGDGFSDIIVGAPLYSNSWPSEGGAFVYHGSASGTTYQWGWTGRGGQSAAQYGFSVGTAGDVNGDGFADIVVGAPDYDGGQAQEGRAFAYHGSAAGLNPTSAWMDEGDQIEAHLGYSVGTAGDVNGDGFSDIIVGARSHDNGQVDEGRAYAYLGTALGLGESPTWSAESDQDGANFGNSVGAAGDVNGDGFSDIVTGAPNYDNGITRAADHDVRQVDAGGAFVYYGNNGGGLDRAPRQMRVDDGAPIALLGRSDLPSGFRLLALGRTPAGRGRVRLQWEVKPLGTPFNGSGLVTGPSFDTGIPVVGTGSAVLLTNVVEGLSGGTLYHWRLRTVGASPFFPRSPWFSPPGNAPSETDLRTGGGTAVGDSPGDATAQRWLEPGAPNPFAIATQLAYTLPRQGSVRLAIYDVAGREVAILADGAQEPGRYLHVWDGRGKRGANLPAGVYFARLTAGGHVESRKVVLVR